jgi:hypothetical protein
MYLAPLGRPDTYAVVVRWCNDPCPTAAGAFARAVARDVRWSGLYAGMSVAEATRVLGLTPGWQERCRRGVNTTQRHCTVYGRQTRAGSDRVRYGLFLDEAATTVQTIMATIDFFPDGHALVSAFRSVVGDWERVVPLEAPFMAATGDACDLGAEQRLRGYVMKARVQCQGARRTSFGDVEPARAELVVHMQLMDPNP